MDVHTREPIISNKTPLAPICDVLLPVVKVSLCKSKIYHVYRLASWLEPNDAIAELHVPVQHASRVHELQARDLCTYNPRESAPPKKKYDERCTPAEWR